ncbi:MAG: biotin/lipoyl-binding protein, partial [Thiobacillus sp.]|nr:biotin/lipoyl-binding protein [Thiobacillus sp.]
MKQRIVAIALGGFCLGWGGPLWAAGQVELTTRVSGVVEEVLVKPGQSVKKGAVLLRLDKTVLQARLDEATAEQARADADEEDAGRELG